MGARAAAWGIAWLFAATGGLPRLAAAQSTDASSLEPLPQAPPVAAEGATPAASPSDLPAEARARLEKAQRALGARDMKAARELGGPLFEAYPGVYAVQDLRCQLAILEWLPREEQDVECAALRRLSGSPDGRAAAQGAPGPAPNQPSASARSQGQSIDHEEGPLSEHPSGSGPPESGANEPEAAATAPGVAASAARELVATYYKRLHWSISPGAVFGRDKVGFSLAGRIQYGVDTGSIIVMPGVDLAGYFVDSNVYVGMPMVELVLPLGPFAPFVEGGAGIGVVTQPSQASLAVLGGGGFVLHPSPTFVLGIEGGYETILGTDFRVILVGPIFAFRF
jgi:hypothetical protein